MMATRSLFHPKMSLLLPMKTKKAITSSRQSLLVVAPCSLFEGSSMEGRRQKIFLYDARLRTTKRARRTFPQPLKASKILHFHRVKGLQSSAVASVETLQHESRLTGFFYGIGIAALSHT